MRDETKAKVLAVKKRVKGGEGLEPALKAEKLSGFSYYKYRNKIVTRRSAKVPQLVTLQNDGATTHDNYARTARVVCLIGNAEDVADILRRGLN